MEETKNKVDFKSKMQKLWGLAFLIFLVIVYSIFGKGFFSYSSLQNILLASSILLIIAIGETFVMITGGIDLSVAFTMGLSTVVAAMTMKAMNQMGINAVIIVIVGFVVGIIVCIIPGFLNGLIITKFGIPPIIVTLGMYLIARGVALLLSGGFPIGKQPSLLGKIGNGYLLYYLGSKGFFWGIPPVVAQDLKRYIIQIIPYPVIFLIIILLLSHFILSRTKFGLYTYLIGGNVEAARRAGVNVNMHLMKIYILSAIFAGLAGMIYCFRYTSGTAIAGEARLFDAIAAVVIGGASITGGYGKLIPGTLIGGLTIAVLQTGLVSMGVSTYYQFLAVGIVIILAVLTIVLQFVK